jgi:hypothetical protein
VQTLPALGADDLLNPPQALGPDELVHVDSVFVASPQVGEHGSR